MLPFFPLFNSLAAPALHPLSLCGSKQLGHSTKLFLLCSTGLERHESELIFKNFPFG